MCIFVGFAWPWQSASKQANKNRLIHWSKGSHSLEAYTLTVQLTERYWNNKYVVCVNDHETNCTKCTIQSHTKQHTRLHTKWQLFDALNLRSSSTENDYFPLTFSWLCSTKSELYSVFVLSESTFALFEHGIKHIVQLKLCGLRLNASVSKNKPFQQKIKQNISFACYWHQLEPNAKRRCMHPEVYLADCYKYYNN